MKSSEYSFKQGYVHGNFHALRSRAGEVYGAAGVICTPSGMVDVYMSSTEAGYQHVSFTAVINGRSYHRWEDRPPSRKLTKVGAKTVAHRWIRQLVEDLKG